jgi:hypothetical protein
MVATNAGSGPPRMTGRGSRPACATRIASRSGSRTRRNHALCHSHAAPQTEQESSAGPRQSVSNSMCDASYGHRVNCTRSMLESSASRPRGLKPGKATEIGFVRAAAEELRHDCRHHDDELRRERPYRRHAPGMAGGLSYMYPRVRKSHSVCSGCSCRPVIANGSIASQVSRSASSHGCGSKRSPKPAAVGST